ncbi:hypothetical protein ACVW1A_004831 [Bradyrhizobium sp. LB1.3]
MSLKTATNGGMTINPALAKQVGEASASMRPDLLSLSIVRRLTTSTDTLDLLSNALDRAAGRAQTLR